MDSVSSKPPQALQDLVESVWAGERDFLSEGAVDLTPGATVDLVFWVGAPLFVTDGHQSRSLDSPYYLGVLPGPARLAGAGITRSAGMRLLPWGAAALFPGGPVEDCAPWTTEVHAALQKRDAAAAVGVITRRLAARTPRGLPAWSETARRVREESLYYLAAAALAAGIPPWPLQRDFRRLLGEEPETFALRARFEWARDLLTRDPDRDPAAIAAETGFSDVTDLSTAFLTYAGTTPGALARSLRGLRESDPQSYKLAFPRSGDRK